MSLLERITAPADLAELSFTELAGLATEIRDFLVLNVSRTGGHLGPNLGVVELTMAVHRVFDSPTDPIIFDTGHQSYVHKILTGRQARFGSLKQADGLSGYPSRAESEHDWVENSHASTSLSWAEGMAKGFRLQGSARVAVAVIGDGALTGGMAWEALNNIAVERDLPLVIVVNDNGRSYTPTVGGLAQQLAGLRTDRRYEQVLDLVKRSVSRAPLLGRTAYDVLHGVKSGLKDVLAPQGLFSDLGLKYIGPIDGHDLAALELALQQAKHFGGPVIVHCLTRKGKGFSAAENHVEDQFHSVGQIDSLTGVPLSAGGKQTWTSLFADTMVEIGAEREDVVAITAAMLHPTGLNKFAAAYPERVFDVGIAEQHALTSAAGLASAGLHPVVALYATFLNRGFDQLLMDVGLHRLGVTLVLDRAGVTGSDGASHNGMWDFSICGLVPGLQLAAPRDGTRLTEALHAAVGVPDGPTVVRYSKEALPKDIPALRCQSGMDILAEDTENDDAERGVLIVSWGQLVGTALQVAERLHQQGITVTVLDPVWALPVNPGLAELAAQYELAVTIEDGGVAGGLGSQVVASFNACGLCLPVRTFGIPQQYLDHGSRSAVLNRIGLTAPEIARDIIEAYSSRLVSSGHAEAATPDEVLRGD